MISYFLVLAVSLCGIFFIVSVQMTREYQDMFESNINERLENASELITNNMTAITRTNMLLQNDMNLISMRYLDTEYSKYIANQELKKYISCTPWLEDVLYLDTRSGEALSTVYGCLYEDGVYSILTSEEKIPIPDKMITSEEMDNQVCVLRGKNKTFYLYAPPCFSNYYKIIYLLSETEMRQILNVCQSPDLLAVGLVTQNDEILLSDEPDILSTVLAAKSDADGALTVNGTQTKTTRCSTPFLSVSLIACTDVNFVNASVHQTFWNVYLVVGVVCILGILCIFTAMRLTYAPLHYLRRRIAFSADPEDDDVAALHKAFLSSKEGELELSRKISSFRSMFQKSIFHLQADNNNKGSSKYEDVERLFSPSHPQAIFVIKMTFFCDRESAWIEPKLRDNLPAGSRILLLEDSPTAFSYLISEPYTENIKEKTALGNFEDFAKETGCRISVSDYSTNPLDVGRLYEHASSALHRSDHSLVVFFDDLDDLEERRENPEKSSYPYELFDTLVHCLEELNFKKAQNTVDLMFAVIERENSPEVISRSILLDAVAQIGAFMNQNAIRYDKYGELFAETMNLCRKAPDEVGKEMIFKNIKELIDIFSVEIANSAIRPAQIKDFVMKNYLESTFSITVLADHFHVSIAYMSLIFKKNFGVNFSDYVWNLRFTKAQELLETTNDTIEQISHAVGYENSSSFRRKFKEHTGISPSQYKKGGTLVARKTSEGTSG